MQDDFRFFKLSLVSRLLIAGGVYAAGISAALALGSARWLGFALALLGWLPLALKVATNRPDEQGLEEWRPVPMEEVDRLDDGLREAKKLQKKVSGLSANSEEAIEKIEKAVNVVRSRSWLSTLIGIAVFALVVLYFIASAMDLLPGIDGDAVVFGLATLALLLAPSLFFGRVKVFTPPEIAMKMPCFRAMLAKGLPQEMAVAPYVRFDKDKNGADVPEDLRLLFELKRPPADLVGVQVQAAINNGPNGKVPYMYAVVLTKGKDGPSYKVAQRFKSAAYEVEPGGDDQYGTVVIRQETSGGGYETSPSDCERLLDISVGLLGAIAKAS
jgi:hypothetical protein